MAIILAHVELKQALTHEHWPLDRFFASGREFINTFARQRRRMKKI